MKRIALFIVLGCLGLLALELPTKTASAAGFIDNYGGALITNRTCASVKQSQVTVGTTAVSFPNNSAGANSAGGGQINALGQLAQRRYVVFCVSKRTTAAAAILTISVDGHTPTAVATDVGGVLAVGDCIQYPVTDQVVPKVISDTAATQVTAFECS